MHFPVARGLFHGLADAHFAFMPPKPFQDLRTKDRNVVTRDAPVDADRLGNASGETILGFSQLKVLGKERSCEMLPRPWSQAGGLRVASPPQGELGNGGHKARKGFQPGSPKSSLARCSGFQKVTALGIPD